jgi:hypothetical protein
MVPIVTGDVHPSALGVSIKLLVTNSELSIIPRKVTAHCKIRAHSTGIFSVITVVNLDPTVGAVEEGLLVSSTYEVIEPNDPDSTSKEASSGSRLSRLMSQHLTHNVSVMKTPVVITDGAPSLVVIVDLHSP